MIRTLDREILLPLTMSVLVLGIAAAGLSPGAGFLDYSHRATGAAGVVRCAIFYIASPAWLVSALTIGNVLRFDDSIASWFLFHTVWALLAYVQWYFLMMAPGWFARDPRRRIAAIGLAAGMVVIASIGVARRWPDPGEEHDIWWFVKVPALLGVGGLVLFVIALLSRDPGSDSAEFNQD